MCRIWFGALTLAAALEIFFQFNGTVEVIFDRAFAPAGDDDNVFDSGRDRFFHGILNQRLVDQAATFLSGMLLWREGSVCPRPAAGMTAFRTFET